MIFYRKVLIIIIVEVLNIDAQSKSLVVLCIFVLSICLQHSYQPLISQKLNDFEIQGIILNLITIYIGLFCSIEQNNTVKTFFTVVFFHLNVCFYFYWITAFWIKNVLHYIMIILKRFFPRFSKKFDSYSEKIHSKYIFIIIL